MFVLPLRAYGECHVDTSTTSRPVRVEAPGRLQRLQASTLHPARTLKAQESAVGGWWGVGGVEADAR